MRRHMYLLFGKGSGWGLNVNIFSFFFLFHFVIKYRRLIRFGVGNFGAL